MAQDRRVRRTRAALHDALLSLMIEKGYEAVTVQDLIDRADVGRSTFYAHFADKDDLLRDALAELQTMVSPARRPDRVDRRRPVRFGLQMLQHVKDQEDLLRAMLARPSGGVVRTEIERLLTVVVKQELDALAEVSAPPRLPADLLAASVVATFMTVLLWWVDEGFRHPPEEVEAVFLTLAGPAIRAAIPPAPAHAESRPTGAGRS
jgi:AcrR family transcriptional regulator